jgi:HEPN domain-containing protein
MEETRRYIRERKIERYADGWRFPVVRGMPSYLSSVSNKDFAFAMLKDADRDHRIGRQLEETGYFDKAVYHFQQAVEKSIKAVLVCLGVFRRTHLVGAALKEACGEIRVPGEWSERLLLIAAHSEALEPDVSLSRYPGIVNDALWLPAEEYDIEDARAARTKSAETFEIAQSFVRQWFSGSQTPPPS